MPLLPHCATAAARPASCPFPDTGVRDRTARSSRHPWRRHWDGRLAHLRELSPKVANDLPGLNGTRLDFSLCMQVG
jgi:hypothetical protein